MHAYIIAVRRAIRHVGGSNESEWPLTGVQIQYCGSNVRHPRPSIADRSHLIVNRSLAPAPGPWAYHPNRAFRSKWFSTFAWNQCHRSHYRYPAKTISYFFLSFRRPFAPRSFPFVSVGQLRWHHWRRCCSPGEWFAVKEAGLTYSAVVDSIAFNGSSLTLSLTYRIARKVLQLNRIEHWYDSIGINCPCSGERTAGDIVDV